jgi:hypothetical protein
MSHVDEGALHAYLDGALDEYPAAEARRIREHVETCAVCADRLEDERKVREESRAILGLAAPEVEVPSFEELKAYVRASRPPRTALSVRLYRLGWAASVVLALGTGWLLRGGGASSPVVTSQGVRAPSGGAMETEQTAGAQAADVANELPVSAPAATTSSTPSAGALAPAAVEVQPPQPERVDAARSREVASAPAAPAPQSAQGFADAGVAAGRGSSATAHDEPSVGVDVTSTVPVEPMRLLDDQLGASGRVGPAPAPKLAGPAAAAPAQQEKVATRQAVPSDTVSRDADAARRSSQGQVLASAIAAQQGPSPSLRTRGASADQRTVTTESLVVPGLELVALLPVNEGNTFMGTRALQKLENGDTLEVVELAEGVEPSTLPPPPSGVRELARPRGAGWLVMRARLTEEQLLALLQRLEAGS